jgi:hypothetical protein
MDAVGGWHDAGDLRKWMDVTMLNGIALLNLLRNFAEPRPGDPTHEQILEEVRFGNRYFLKMQDTDGKVWADTAGGVNGDNSDNHWTDNIVGTSDDRYISTTKRSRNHSISRDRQVKCVVAGAKVLAVGEDNTRPDREPQFDQASGV